LSDGRRRDGIVDGTGIVRGKIVEGGRRRICIATTCGVTRAGITTCGIATCVSPSRAGAIAITSRGTVAVRSGAIVGGRLRIRVVGGGSTIVIVCGFVSGGFITIGAGVILFFLFFLFGVQTDNQRDVTQGRIFGQHALRAQAVITGFAEVVVTTQADVQTAIVVEDRRAALVGRGHERIVTRIRRVAAGNRAGLEGAADTDARVLRLDQMLVAFAFTDSARHGAEAATQHGHHRGIGRGRVVVEFVAIEGKFRVGFERYLRVVNHPDLRIAIGADDDCVPLENLGTARKYANVTRGIMRFHPPLGDEDGTDNVAGLRL
jgi:hypothetical protein